MTPKEQADLKLKLCEIITDTGDEPDDAKFFERLCVSLQFLSNEIYRFKDDFYYDEDEEDEGDEE